MLTASEIRAYTKSKISDADDTLLLLLQDLIVGILEDQTESYFRGSVTETSYIQAKNGRNIWLPFFLLDKSNSIGNITSIKYRVFSERPQSTLLLSNIDYNYDPIIQANQYPSVGSWQSIDLAQVVIQYGKKISLLNGYFLKDTQVEVIYNKGFTVFPNPVKFLVLSGIGFILNMMGNEGYAHFSMERGVDSWFNSDAKMLPFYDDLINDYSTHIIL